MEKSKHRKRRFLKRAFRRRYKELRNFANDLIFIAEHYDELAEIAAKVCGIPLHILNPKVEKSAQAETVAPVNLPAEFPGEQAMNCEVKYVMNKCMSKVNEAIAIPKDMLPEMDCNIEYNPDEASKEALKYDTWLGDRRNLEI